MAEATRQFLQHGYAAVSVDHIVRAAGGSKTMLYAGFGNKQGLFAAVTERLCDDFIRDFKQLNLTGADLAGGLSRLGRSLLAVLLRPEHLAFQRLVIAESARFPELGQVWWRQGPAQSRETIARFLGQRQAAGEMRSADPLRAAALFHEMLVSEPVQLGMFQTPPSPRWVDEHIAQVVQVFVHGYGFKGDSPKA